MGGGVIRYFSDGEVVMGRCSKDFFWLERFWQDVFVGLKKCIPQRSKFYVKQSCFSFI